MLLIEEAIHQEELPKVDYVVDQYSIIAKFLNSIKYEEQVLFSLTPEKFRDLHMRIHEQTTGNRLFPSDDIKEFDVTFEGRLFIFLKLEV
jgi:hypothetical protein